MGILSCPYLKYDYDVETTYAANKGNMHPNSLARPHAKLGRLIGQNGAMAKLVQTFPKVFVEINEAEDLPECSCLGPTIRRSGDERHRGHHAT